MNVPAVPLGLTYVAGTVSSLSLRSQGVVSGWPMFPSLDAIVVISMELPNSVNFDSLPTSSLNPPANAPPRHRVRHTENKTRWYFLGSTVKEPTRATRCAWLVLSTFSSLTHTYGGVDASRPSYTLGGFTDAFTRTPRAAYAP